MYTLFTPLEGRLRKHFRGLLVEMKVDEKFHPAPLTNLLCYEVLGYYLIYFLVFSFILL